jgi:hypothetical protein
VRVVINEANEERTDDPEEEIPELVPESVRELLNSWEADERDRGPKP